MADEDGSMKSGPNGQGGMKSQQVDQLFDHSSPDKERTWDHSQVRLPKSHTNRCMEDPQENREVGAINSK